MTTYNVTPAHPISGVTLNSGDFAFVSSGGTATNTITHDGGVQSVLPSGAAIGTVMRGGYEYVSSGGVATGTVISSGTEAIYGGGTANFTVVSGNGHQSVYGGGTATSAVLSGGTQAVYAGGAANSTVISNGGAEAVYVGGLASGTVLSSGGGEFVYSGGEASGAVVKNGGSLTVFQGGTASGAVVSSGGTVSIDPGATLSFAVVSRGGSIDLTGLFHTSGGSAVLGANDVLTVIEGGSTVTLQLAGPYSGETFQTAQDSGTGTMVTLVEAPRTMVWTGAKDANFGSAANWNDLTNSLNPAAFAPNSGDTTEFLTGGGIISGTGTAAILRFDGLSAWDVMASASLSAASGVTVGDAGTGTLLIASGASVNGLGAADTISGVSGGVASVTVDGSGSSWQSAGELVAGDLGTGNIVVENAATLGASAAGSLPAMALGVSVGGSGSLSISGAGSRATLTGQLNVGQAGAGTLTVGNQGTIRTGNDAALDPAEGLDLASVSGGSGTVNVSGTKSLLANIGRFVIGDQGLGGLSIQSGATVTTSPGSGSALPGAVVGNSAGASGSSVSVIGAGSNLIVGGLLDVGAAGSGSLQLSGGATVTAGSLDAGISASAVGQISLSGAGTSLTVTGDATVADDGTGVLSVLNGATFSATNLTIGSQGDSSGALIVSGAGSVINLTGSLNIGTALGVGDLTIGPGGAVHASVVNLQGQVVLEGGNLDPTVTIINQGQTAGGNGTLQAGDIIDEGVIQAGGTKPSQRLLVVQGTVMGGGTLTINGTVQPSNPVGVLQINASGTMELTGPVLNAATTTFTDNLAQPGTYSVNNSVVDVTFADGAGVLLLDDIAEFGGTVTTMFGGDSFVIAGGTLSNLGVSNGNTLTFSDSGVNARPGGIDEIIFGNPISLGIGVHLQWSIANSNTVVFGIVGCFCEGTRIETETGPVAVEDLAIGDRVVTHDRGLDPAVDADDRSAEDTIRCEPVEWIGSRFVNCAAHPTPKAVWPVRVAAGAFGPGLPRCDLFLSPDHAVFVNGVLVPVKLLINRTSIAQVERDRVRYFHVELPRHDVILTEGLPVESYLDIGDRADFDGDVIRLFPDFTARLGANAASVWETRGAAKLVTAGPELTAARQVIRRVSRQREARRKSGIRER